MRKYLKNEPAFVTSPPAEDVCQSASYEVAADCLITIATPVFNRETTIRRTYDSIARQSDLEGVEWIVVDDGSSDGSLEVLKEIAAETEIPMKVLHQVNSGKHVASNRMLELARGALLLILDSDDVIVDDAIATIKRDWDALAPDVRSRVKGVAYTCRFADTGEITGMPHRPKQYPLVCSDLDYRLKYGYRGDNFGAVRVDLLRQYPFPQYEGLQKFCPESIVWFEMSKKYPMVFLGDSLKIMYRDVGNHLTGKNTNRAPSNFYLWQYMVNNIGSYFRYNPKEVLKGYVGMVRDGIYTGRSMAQVLSCADTIGRRVGLMLAWPVGWALAKLGK